jgi:hypothetical protein
VPLSISDYGVVIGSRQFGARDKTIIRRAGRDLRCELNWGKEYCQRKNNRRNRCQIFQQLRRAGEHSHNTSTGSE